jgi:hypothetical protein
METVCSSEMLISTYKYARRYILDQHRYLHLLENVKAHMRILWFGGEALIFHEYLGIETGRPRTVPSPYLWKIKNFVNVIYKSPTVVRILWNLDPVDAFI